MKYDSSANPCGRGLINSNATTTTLIRLNESQVYSVRVAILICSLIHLIAVKRNHIIPLIPNVNNGLSTGAANCCMALRFLP